MKKVVVISLGGSILIPKDEKDSFLIKFKKVLENNYRRYKFVIVCGGGIIAREYQSVLKKEHKNEKELSLAGIRATRMNAQFVMQVFGKEANDTLPLTMTQVKNDLAKNNTAICGALRYTKKSTTDATAARLAEYLKGEFINITNVQGLFTADPRKNKNAKLIPYENWGKFEKRANRIKYHPGQHFVLDQKAAVEIRKRKIITHIIGKDLKALDNLLKKRKFVGTTIGP